MFLLQVTAHLLKEEYVRPRIAVAIISGISVKAIAHDMIDESPIINVMIPVVFADSSTILGMSFNLNDL